MYLTAEVNSWAFYQRNDYFLFGNIRVYICRNIVLIIPTTIKMVKLLSKDIYILAVSLMACVVYYVEFKTVGYIKWLLIGLRW